MTNSQNLPVPDKGRTIEIQKLNDLLRRHWIGGEIVFSREVSEMFGGMALGDLVFTMGRFDYFTPDNDPHGEHDFGAFEMFDHKFFWKIDYYNLTMDGHSPDPANPNLTCRVLTLMLASEY